MKNIHDEGIVNLSLFATSRVSPKEPHQECERALPSPSAEVAFFHRATAEGGHPDTGVTNSSGVRIHGPRESDRFSGGKGGVPPIPWESSNIESVGFSSIGSLLSGYEGKEVKKSARRVFKNQRNELLAWFFDRVRPHWGGKKPLEERYVGVWANSRKLSTRDLFYMKSIFVDTEKRKNIDEACKEFWGSVKPREDIPTV